MQKHYVGESPPHLLFFVKTTSYWLPFPPSVSTSSAQRSQNDLCYPAYTQDEFWFLSGPIKFYRSAVRWLVFDDLDQNPDEDVF